MSYYRCYKNSMLASIYFVIQNFWVISSFCSLFFTHNSEQGGDEIQILLYCATESGRGFFVWHHFEQRLNFKNLYQTNQPIGLHILYIILRIVLWWYLNNWNLNIIYLETFSAKHQYFVLFETIFSFSKLHGFEKAALNTFSSVLKTY